VLVLTCHEDNCHSRQGNRASRAREPTRPPPFSRNAVPTQRGLCSNAGANMETELDTILSEFSATPAQHS
jgi:hypothetical protein